MTCKRCKERVKDWNGDDPTCSFPDGVFDEAGWNCATANAIRDIFEAHPDLVVSVGDQKYGHLPILMESQLLDDLDERFCLWVSWYKNRGRTEAMWLLDEMRSPKIPTLREIELIIEKWERCA